MQYKLSKKKQNRERMLRNLATSLVLYESITTTNAKAKALKPLMIKLINCAKENNLTSRRKASRILYNDQSISKLFEDISPRLLNSNNSNIRLYNIGKRIGDRASLSKISITLKPLEKAIIEETKNKNKNSTKVTETPHDETK